MRGDKQDFGLSGPSVDQLIDAALRSYGQPEEAPKPRVVLARLLERAHAEEAARGRVWIWGWAVAASCMAVLLVALGALWMSRGPRSPEIAWSPGAPGVVRDASSSAGAVAGSHPAGAGPHAAQAEISPQQRQIPRLDVFPTPRPLSTEERALVAFAKQGPVEVQRAVIEDQKHWDDPIIVADLQEQPKQAGEPQDR